MINRKLGIDRSSKEGKRRYWREYKQIPEIKEKRKQYSQKEYYQKNKEEIDKKNKLWFIKNLDKARAYSRKSMKKWKKNPENKGKIKMMRRKSRADKNKIMEVFTQEEWESKKQNTKGICPECKEYVGVNKLTLDHIFPISKAEQNRIYTINDVQPLCLKCNAIKGNKIKILQIIVGRLNVVCSNVLLFPS